MDVRAGSLEGQVMAVIKNYNEFNMSMDSIIERVSNNEKYKNKRVDSNIRHAIASYIKYI